MVQKLLEYNDPELQCLATASVSNTTTWYIEMYLISASC
jgi:hypothetical protein